MSTDPLQLFSAVLTTNAQDAAALEGLSNALATSPNLYHSLLPRLIALCTDDRFRDNAAYKIWLLSTVLDRAVNLKYGGLSLDQKGSCARIYAAPGLRLPI